jgi:hypothetical protein
MTMDQAERFSKLVGEIYDAVLDPSPWSGVVHMRSVDIGRGRWCDRHRVNGYPPHPEVGTSPRFNSRPRGSSLMLALSWCGAVELAPYLSRTMPAAEGNSAAAVSTIADPDVRLRG